MSGEQSLTTVIGSNARKARRSAGLTLDQVAAAARRRGLRWSESRVADFEAGRVAPNLTTLAAVCLALADLGCRKATLPDLVTHPRPVEINESLELSSRDLRNVLSGRPAEKPKQRKLSVDEMSKIRAWAAYIPSGATEDRVRKSLGISSDDLAAGSQALWKRSFAEERDRRAGPGANAQKRGQISRQLKAELQKAINDGHN